jgi:hypothetical protein
MFDLKLTEAQEQLLRNQVIDANQPGAVLRDFRTVLDFVGTQGVKAVGKYNMLPIESIQELNQKLSRPLLLGAWKRPQLRSHPYLQGLHLLLRASGLSRVEGTGDQARLLVDAAMRARWDQLNATEQYFNLLEAWLCLGQPEMVGEKGGGWDTILSSCFRAWHFLPAAGKTFDIDHPQQVRIMGVQRSYYLLALMDLFGLLEVKHPDRPIQPWCPAGVGHTPFGDAVFTLLSPGAIDPEQLILDEETEEEDAAMVHLGAWQPLFKPYFPQWQHNLELPEVEFREGVYLFKVSLGKVWRRIAMPADATLDDLVGWILDSVDFGDDHLYEFTYRDEFGGKVAACDPRCEEEVSAADVLIGELPLGPGQSMKLLYDFGDNWEFGVKLESIEPPGKKLKAPRIMETHGKAPKQYPEWD